jgi:NTE family protein
MPQENFVPEPQERKIPNSIGLSLSGGGFRATLFHLGAIRRLNEFGTVAKLTTISSVSGGSILNGFLATHLNDLPHGIADFDKQVSQPVRQFCGRDIRRWLALEALIPGTHNSFGLAKQYDEHLTDGALLRNIPAAPVHVFCSTDLAFGVNWTFKKRQCGDYRVGFMDTPDWTVGTAVAASSCFPPVFKPMNLNLDPARLKFGSIPPAVSPGPVRDKCIRDLTFSDGGVYDNLGLEPIWKDHKIVLSSDGGALFPIGGDTGFAWEVGRFIAIPENQALSVRKRWLISNFISGQLHGTYWGIGSSCSDYGVQQGYSSNLAKSVIAAIRTDLDSFSEAEAAVLENHGYWLADAAIRAHVEELLPAHVPELILPHPEWAEPEEKIREALRDSSHRSLLGRGHGA